MVCPSGTAATLPSRTEFTPFEPFSEAASAVTSGVADVTVWRTFDATQASMFGRRGGSTGNLRPAGNMRFGLWVHDRGATPTT